VGRRKLHAGVAPDPADHPHACGEKGIKETLDGMGVGSSPRVWGEVARQRLTCSIAGSSPRVWGEAPRTRRMIVVTRIIPTRVGRRASTSAGCAVRADHPHACGEKKASPSARDELQRIIPTRVGRRADTGAGQGQGADHPHACGEKHAESVTAKKTTGSSPRVWGEAERALGAALNSRIIPTRVGRRQSN